MKSPSDQPTHVQVLAAQRRTPYRYASQADRAATEQGSSLVRSALAFAVRCHAGQRRDSDGAPFIEHPLEVARLLRDAGCSDVVVAAGLVHDVVDDTQVILAELTARFGADVANLVEAITDNASLQSYRQRKQMVRERVRNAGGDTALLFAADKISELRELPHQVRRDSARFDTAALASRARNHLERYQQMRLEHYHESLRILQLVAPLHPLVIRLANELDSCSTALRGGAARRRT